MKTKGCFGFFAAFLFTRAAQALIPFDTGTDVDNTYNTTAPLNGAPWNYIAEVTNSDVSTDASAIYLGNDFLITANHVNLGSTILLDGTSYNIDATYTPQEVGSADLKLFKITGSTGLAPLTLTNASLGTGDLNAASTMIGWGVGKGSAIMQSGSNVGWTWGGDSTRAERWGTNVTLSGYYSGSDNVQYLATAFNPSLGANVASATLGDSGSGLFQLVSGTWELAGIYTDVDTPNASYYADSPNNLSGMDNSYAVEVEPYSAQIEAAIPEPGSYALAGIGGAVVAVFARRRMK